MQPQLPQRLYTRNVPLNSQTVAGKQPAAVQLDRVSLLFGSFVALRDLSLTLPAGGSVVLLGENGAGKSTLLRVIAGLVSREFPAASLSSVIHPATCRGRIASHGPRLTALRRTDRYGEPDVLRQPAHACFRSRASRARRRGSARGRARPRQSASRRRIFAGDEAARRARPRAAHRATACCCSTNRSPTSMLPPRRSMIARLQQWARAPRP